MLKYERKSKAKFHSLFFIFDSAGTFLFTNSLVEEANETITGSLLMQQTFLDKINHFAGIFTGPSHSLTTMSPETCSAFFLVFKFEIRICFANLTKSILWTTQETTIKRKGTHY